MAKAISAPRALDPLTNRLPSSVAIAAEILVAALRDDRLLGRLDDQPGPRRIGFEAVAEALISEVDERDQAALGDQAGDDAPLVHVEIGAGGIVAAAVEQDEVARLGLAERRHHPIEADLAAVAGVIGIADHLDSGRGDQGRVIGPGRLAGEDPGERVGPGDQLGAEPKRAAAARSLQADDPAVVRCVRAEHDRPDQLDETDVALRADIGLGRLGLDEAALGRLDALQDRGVAGGVAIDSDSDVDLLRTGIGIGERDQSDQRILRLVLEPLEQHRGGRRQHLVHPRLLSVRLYNNRAAISGQSGRLLRTLMKRLFHDKAIS